jgi:hypothetical protein
MVVCAVDPIGGCSEVKECGWLTPRVLLGVSSLTLLHGLLVT